MVIDNMLKKEKEFEDKLTSFLPKEEIVKDEVVIKTKEELSKMKEVDLVAYWLSIWADVNIKYSKAKNIDNILLRQTI